MSEATDLLREILLNRLGVRQMSHNGHMWSCAFAAPDWIDTDICTCGRDELIIRIIEFLRENEEERA